MIDYSEWDVKTVYDDRCPMAQYSLDELPDYVPIVHALLGSVQTDEALSSIMAAIHEHAACPCVLFIPQEAGDKYFTALMYDSNRMSEEEARKELDVVWERKTIH